MGIALVASGVALLINKKARTVVLLWGGILLAFILIFHVPYMLFVSPHPSHLGSWAGTLNTLALSGMAFVVAGSFGKEFETDEHIPALLRQLERLIPFGRFFCITVVAFGICHFLRSLYRNIGPGLDSMAQILDLFRRCMPYRFRHRDHSENSTEVVRCPARNDDLSLGFYPPHSAGDRRSSFGTGRRD
jgi:hypothetical protein